jgi:predicted kinase
MTKTPTCYVLVGLPGAGKSTWVANQGFDWNRTVIASTDNYIERAAAAQGKTYSDVFKDEGKAAVAYMAETVVDAVRNQLDIVWDQTSTTPNTRTKKLRMLTPNYRKIAVVFATPDAAEHDRRLASRPGKHIPATVINQMKSQFVRPTREEGFDEIWDV